MAPSIAERFENTSPVGRVGDHGELADLAAYLVCERLRNSRGACLHERSVVGRSGAAQRHYQRKTFDAPKFGRRPFGLPRLSFLLQIKAPLKSEA